MKGSMAMCPPERYKRRVRIEQKRRQYTSSSPPVDLPLLYLLLLEIHRNSSTYWCLYAYAKPRSSSLGSVQLLHVSFVVATRPCHLRCLPTSRYIDCPRIDLFYLYSKLRILIVVFLVYFLLITWIIFQVLWVRETTSFAQYTVILTTPTEPS